MLTGERDPLAGHCGRTSMGCRSNRLSRACPPEYLNSDGISACAALLTRRCIRATRPTGILSPGCEIQRYTCTTAVISHVQRRAVHPVAWFSAATSHRRYLPDQREPVANRAEWRALSARCPLLTVILQVMPPGSTWRTHPERFRIAPGGNSLTCLVAASNGRRSVRPESFPSSHRREAVIATAGRARADSLPDRASSKRRGLCFLRQGHRKVGTYAAAVGGHLHCLLLWEGSTRA